ncbi:MAG: hypothetical protein HY275_14280 [Gemmatimonadetes bacterium]|nr:hypothetical protein [Gemmatimonadota bacterium]
MLLLPLPTGGAASAAIDHLRWMAGCWEQRNGARVAHEQWMAPLGGTMLGMSRTVVGDATREYEQLRIEQRPAGDLAYVASPSGQATATFVASAASDSLVRFENPAHDFPQRIQYRRAGADSLIARIEGTRNGQVRGIDFPMRRVPCAGERVAGSGG